MQAGYWTDRVNVSELPESLSVIPDERIVINGCAYDSIFGSFALIGKYFIEDVHSYCLNMSLLLLWWQYLIQKDPFSIRI